MSAITLIPQNRRKREGIEVETQAEGEQQNVFTKPLTPSALPPVVLIPRSPL